MHVPSLLKSLLAAVVLVATATHVDATTTTATTTKPCVTVSFRNDSPTTTAGVGAATQGVPPPPSSSSSSLPSSPLIHDGRIVTAVVKLDPSFAANPPTQVEISAPGLQFGRTTFTFDKHDKSTFEQVVTCRTESGSAPGQDGARVNVPITLTYKQGPVPKETQIVQRHVVSSGRCSGWGDPHLTTFDGVAYDFQTAGVFRLVQAGTFQVQIFQEKCGPVKQLQQRAPSCYQGVAVAFGASVARFFIVDGKLRAAKGSSGLQWLSVEKLAAPTTDGYRVFTNVDHATYVDINLATWDTYKYPYLNVALQVSPYFKSSLVPVSGLMGNWNGDRRDDLTNNDQLAALHGVSLSHNLFTCVNDGCAPLLRATSLEDTNALGLPTHQPLLHQGYTVVAADAIPLQAFASVLKPLALRRRLDENREYTAGRVEVAPVTADASVASVAGTNASATVQAVSVTNATAVSVGDTTTTAPTVTITATATTAPTATTATTATVVTTKRATQLCTRVIQSVATCAKYVRDTPSFIATVCAADAVLLNDLSVVDGAKLTYLRECRRELDARLEAQVSSAADVATLRRDRASLQFGDLSHCFKNCSGRGECLAAGCKCRGGFTGHGCDVRI